MKILEGKIAIITGGSRGIGKAIVELFAHQGAQVHFTYSHSADKVREIEKTLESSVKSYQLNATDEQGTHELVEQIAKDSGKLDIVVNNAGITRDNLLLRMSRKDWEEVLHTNLTSFFFLTKAAIKPMLKQKSGSIVNISSVVGLTGNSGQANYAASKAGIIGFTKSVAKELGSRNIRCNAIAPGFIATEMTSLDEKVVKNWLKDIPLKKSGTPEDIAKVALFLASDLSSYITAEVLNVNGGMH
ncbi:3-oxoacyl-[acyl-carrier-protein] reductase [Bacteroidetes bacterium endosymbiont of Geopemphigus sp.]|uniref:3-oxoacyl-[acyl-carrier-protein] reductase n=1 Tax=Bacteroidetes bacterium endosymbiont of Geopemphigus sp. TaxID=2047937 RepID=UPI000CD15CE0|nr:3-oxoacyl-[acyl-carrier-protein] reductase [Bacteroidetes bacterium endosymbiont of Geopemphigus sp.]